MNNKVGAKPKNIVGKARSYFWSSILSLSSNGVGVTKDNQTLPIQKKYIMSNKPLIMIANHQSHADSALLSAVFGRSNKLIFAAGAGYWDSKWYRKLAGRVLIRVHTIREGREGWEDLFELRESIKNGEILVIFPEGTRSKNGEIGEFKSGAFRLAVESGADIIPVAILGTEELLPKNKSYQRAALEVRVGEYMSYDEFNSVEQWAEKSRERLKLLKNSRGKVTIAGRTFTRVSKLSASKAGLFFAAIWAFSEAIFWPFTAELAVLLLTATALTIKRGVVLALFAAVGSVVGVYTHWYLSKRGYDIPLVFTTERMYQESVKGWGNPFQAGREQMFNGIPIKVYAKAAGDLGLSAYEVFQAMVPRAVRIISIGVISTVVSIRIRRFLKPCLGILQLTFLLFYGVGLYLVIRSWS